LDLLLGKIMCSPNLASSSRRLKLHTLLSNILPLSRWC
jgi:hypothetical protein